MRILLAGLPRSGTTWCARALAAAPGVTYVHEPDNWRNAPYAPTATHGLGHDRDVVPGHGARAYERLWTIAFRGGWPQDRLARLATRVARSKRSVPRQLGIAAQTAIAVAAARRTPPTEHVLVKTVHASRSVEWLAERFQPRVVIIWRNPVSVFASYKQFGWAAVAAQQRGEPPAAADADPQTIAASLVGWIAARTRSLLEAAHRHPDWIVVRHEDLLTRRTEAFEDLVQRIGLTWTSAIEDFITSSDKAGQRFSTNRDAATVGESWRSRLTSDEIAAANAVLDRYTRLEVVGGEFAACIRPV